MNTPMLLVVVDTEEEFNWIDAFNRKATSVQAMAQVELGQKVCDAFGVTPVYVVDFPVASQEEGFAALKEFQNSGRATIGTHLHPWVSPPHDEKVSNFLSFPGNLPPALEEEKLRRLTEKIHHSFGQRPVIYKAGRYGVGINTSKILKKLGYEVDLSPAPPFDFRTISGPDFSTTPNQPHLWDPEGELLCLPATGDYVGLFSLSRTMAHGLYLHATQPWAKRLHLPGILARTRLLERIRLSPEGHSLEEMKRLTLALHKRGLDTFSLTFHSPSLAPGFTPYVADRFDLERFLETLHRYLHFFLEDLHGSTTTPLEIKRLKFPNK